MATKLARFLLLGILTVFLASAQAPAQKPVTFVQITDTHVNNPASQEDLRAVLRDIARQKPRPDFLIVTGDLTEFGTRQELLRYRAIMDSSGLPYLSLLGNHDSRWGGLSVQEQEKLLGNPPYFALESGGVQFVALNSALPLEAWGDLDPAQLAWLNRVLEQGSENAPRILFAHHPVGLPKQDFLCNGPELWHVLNRHTVSLFLVGHGHRYVSWKVNGVPFQMGAACVKRRAYLRVTVGPDLIRLEHRVVGQPEPLHRRSLLLLSQAFGTPLRLRATADGARGLLRIHIRPALPDLNWRELRWEMRRNREAWFPVAPDSTAGTILDSLNRYPPGLNTVWLRVKSPDGGIFLARAEFSNPSRDVRILWLRNLGMRIQAPLASDGKHLFIAGSEKDARVIALELSSGRTVWSQALPGAVLKGIALDSSGLWVGTTDGTLALLDRATGVPLLRKQLGAPIIGPPASADSLLIVTTGGGQVLCLRKRDGQVLWTFRTGEMIQSRPAVAQGKVFFGGWDRRFHALDLRTGKELWSKEISASRYFAPATPNPVVIGDEVVFVAAAAPGRPSVFACSAANGDTLWTYPISSHYASPLALGDRLIFGVVAGGFYALDARAGRPLWSFTTPEPVFDASPVPFGGAVLAPTLFGTVYRIEPHSGKAAKLFQAGDHFLFSTPVVAGNRIFTASVSGTVLAVQVSENLLKRRTTNGESAK